jgi:hypothetical protein
VSSEPVPRPGTARRTVPRRPDPTRLRFGLAAGGLAALSALITAIATPMSTGAPVPPAVPASAPASATTVVQRRPIQYVQLAPGQSAPPGARVIDAKAPKPITIVTLVPAPAAQQPVVIRTTQSGKVIP